MNYLVFGIPANTTGGSLVAEDGDVWMIGVEARAAIDAAKGAHNKVYGDSPEFESYRCIVVKAADIYTVDVTPPSCAVFQPRRVTYPTK